MGQGSAPEPSAPVPLVAPKQPLRAPRAPKLGQSSHPEKTAPLKADFETTTPAITTPPGGEPETALRDRYRIAQFRRIKRHKSFAIIPHDSPSLLEALPGQSGQPS